MTFDIRTLAISKTGEVPLRNAAGEKQYDADGKLRSITVYSPGTREFNAAQHARTQRNNDRVMAKMQGKADGKQSAEDATQERAEFLAGITVSFNNVGIEGKAAFAKVYADLELGHIADDVEKFVADRANFIRPSTPD